MKDSEQVARNIITALSETTDGPVFDDPSYMPTGAVREILARFDIRAMTFCPHVTLLASPSAFRSGETPTVVLWAAWRPDRLVCHDCRSELEISDNTANHRCDGCGKLSIVLQVGASVIESEEPGMPPLVCTYGLCPDCTERSRMLHS